MNKIELCQAFESITPTNIQTERIYNKVMASEVRPKNIYIKAILATTLCIIILFATGTYFISNTTYVPPTKLITPSSEMMSQVRKTMIFNGKRYVFLNNGALYDFNEELTEKLGTLDGNINSDANPATQNAQSSAFAQGRDVYKIPYYNEDFRVAVKDENGFYICESVDEISGEVNLAEFFEAADILKNTKDVFVYNHFGNECFDKLKNREFKKLYNIIINANGDSGKELTNEEFEAIGKAQSNGESFKMVLILKDETTFEFYIIPDLGIVMVGDNRYKVPKEFSGDLKDFFKDYERSTDQPLN